MKKRRMFVFYAVIGTLFGLGFFPVAPATLASVVICLVMWYLVKSILFSIVLLTLLFIIGVWVSGKIEKIWGEDDRRIVIDESVGMIITLLAVPHKVLFFFIGFCLFRFFDIVKPYPINESQRLRSGCGVVLDDVIAGMYSSIILWLFVIIHNAVKSI